MGNIQIVNGDIFQSGADVIVHQVNCQGVMASGIAKQVREKYPYVFSKYKIVCERYKEDHREKTLLGQTQIVKVGEEGTKYIANLFAQKNFGYDGKCYTNYDALRRCLAYVAWRFKHESVAIPYLMACHRGGGDWDKVSKIIEEELEGRNVTFYKYTG